MPEERLKRDRNPRSEAGSPYQIKKKRCFSYHHLNSEKPNDLNIIQTHRYRHGHMNEKTGQR